MPYYHFGDIDCGGFLIFEHLKARTQIPFIPLHMDVETLRHYQQQAIPLTQNDEAGLIHFLKKYDDFHEVIQYMLNNHVKLEQENVAIIFDI